MLNYIVKIKKGILWENKSNFTVYDVQFTIDLIKQYFGTDEFFGNFIQSVKAGSNTFSSYQKYLC